MPLNVKLHRIQLEVAHFIGLSRGKLVPMSEIRKKFETEHRLSEAMWILIEQKVIVESPDFLGHYQVTRDGAVTIDEQWEKLQEELAKGKKVPAVRTEDAADTAEEKARLRKLVSPEIKIKVDTTTSKKEKSDGDEGRA